MRMQTSQSLPALGIGPRSQSQAFSQAAYSSTEFLVKSIGGTNFRMKMTLTTDVPRASSSTKAIPQFNQTQFYSTPFDVAYEELAKARNLHKLEILFVEADADGSGEMSLDEFRDALRMPRIRGAFAVLGVQPHQSELVFKSLLQGVGKAKNGELSITEFMRGLTALVGTDVDGTGKELDIEKLRPAHIAKMRNQSVCELGKHGLTSAKPKPAARRPSVNQGPVSVFLLPKVKVQRAFVHSASAQALHAATAQRRPLKLAFPI